MSATSAPPGFLLYQTEDGQTRLDVRLDQDTVWLALNQLAHLFQRDKSVISRHIANIFAEGELARESVVAFFATTAADDKTYRVEHFNLDVIISVGYRVKSQRGTQFRIWATQHLREVLVQAFCSKTTVSSEVAAAPNPEKLPVRERAIWAEPLAASEQLRAIRGRARACPPRLPCSTLRLALGLSA